MTAARNPSPLSPNMSNATKQPATTYRVVRDGFWFRWTNGTVTSPPVYSSRAGAWDAATDHGYRNGFCKPMQMHDGSLEMRKA